MTHDGLRALEELHEVEHFFVSHFGVAPKVRASMAVRAKPDHETRIVRSAIGHPADMVDFEKRNATRCLEGRQFTAVLAAAFCTGENVVPNDTTALEHVAGLLPLAWSRRRGRKCSCSKCGKIHSDYRFRKAVGRNRFDHCFKWPELEDYRTSQVADRVRRALHVEALTDIRALKSQPCFVFGEEQEVFAVLGMVQDGAVAPCELHIADLPFSEVFKNTVRPKAIRVAMCHTFSAGNDCDDGKRSWSDDTSLLLAAEALVNVCPAIVGSPGFKSPAQTIAPPLLGSENTVAANPAPVEQQHAGVVLNIPFTAGTGGGRSAQDSPKIDFPHRRARA